MVSTVASRLAAPSRPAVSTRRARPARLVGWGLQLMTGALLATGAASGATLGGVTSPGLAGFSMASTTGGPSVLAYDNFTGSNGSALLNTITDDGGHTWTASSGTWTVQSNQAQSTSVALGYLMFNGNSANGSVEATINRHGNNSWQTFLIFNADATTADALTVAWWSSNGGGLELYKDVAGTFTRLAGVTGLYPSTIPASAVVRLESTSSSIINLYLDGVLRATYTLTAGEQTTFKNSTHKYVGIGTTNDAISTFDNFHVDA